MIMKHTHTTNVTIQRLKATLRAETHHPKVPQTQTQSHLPAMARTSTEKYYQASHIHRCHLERYHRLRKGRTNTEGSDS